jgi:hypothetical protein
VLSPGLGRVQLRRHCRELVQHLRRGADLTENKSRVQHRVLL